ncbi:MAG: putative porin [Desulfobacteraceae bacterium]
MAHMRSFWTAAGHTTPALLLMLLFFVTTPAWATEDTETLRRQMDDLKRQVEVLQEKLEKVQEENKEQEESAKEMDKRLNKAELHTATDKLSFGVDFRVRAESDHYNDVQMAPTALINGFFTDIGAGGFNGGTLQQIQQGMANMIAGGMVPPTDKADADNDIIYTNRLRLDMNARVNPQLTFGGRLAAYKVFGDSTGVKFNQGSMGDVTFDGNTSSLPHGDTLRLERAFFNYGTYLGSAPFNISFGRRPSTEGPPLEYRNYGLEGGSPLAHLINWQFDGASATFGLEDVTGIPGASFKLCYGVGFEGDWGNGSSLSSTRPDVEDVHMFGFIADLYNDDVNSVVLNYAHASDITDGFTGLTVMPFIVSKRDANGDGTDEYYFEQNSGGFISRLEPMTNIGDWDGASLLLRTNLGETSADIDLFLSGSWSHTKPSRVSRNPFFEIMGQGLLNSNGELESHDGYSIYAGAIFPMPLEARLGLEYNWGSQYWLNFTGAEDSLVASKLAARGQVWEAYYHQPVFDRNFFLTLGGQYYDYDYAGSGNPVGEPVKISELTSLDALNAVVDEVWLVYLSANLRF